MNNNNYIIPYSVLNGIINSKYFLFIKFQVLAIAVATDITPSKEKREKVTKLGAIMRC